MNYLNLLPRELQFLIARIRISTDFCDYNMFIDYHTGQFEKIPIRKRRIERNYQRLPKMKVA